MKRITSPKPQPPKTKSKLRKEDVVMIIAGKEKGRSGKILDIDNQAGRVTVEGCNVQKKTVKKSKENTGGIIEKEAPIHLSNVMYLDGNTPSRLGYKIEKREENKKSTKLRVAKKSGNIL